MPISLCSFIKPWKEDLILKTYLRPCKAKVDFFQGLLLSSDLMSSVDITWFNRFRDVLFLGFFASQTSGASEFL